MLTIKMILVYDVKKFNRKSEMSMSLTLLKDKVRLISKESLESHSDSNWKSCTHIFSIVLEASWQHHKQTKTSVNQEGHP